MKPTTQQFKKFQELFDYFNEELFEGELPPVILNFSRKANTAGFFAPNRWKSLNGDNSHEISLNPISLSQSKDYVIQTLVHEMCHLWQEENGSPGSKGYHNKEWVEKMESVGLIPSDTEEPGGKQVGFKMGDYLEEGGRLEHLIEALDENIWLPFKAIEFQSLEELEDLLEEAKEAEDEEAVEQIEQIIKEAETKLKKQKMKYECPNCNNKIWGKPNMSVICGDCNKDFEQEFLD